MKNIFKKFLSLFKRERKYSFDELFERKFEGNQRLIYPKFNSPVYKKFRKDFKSKINMDLSHTYVPVYDFQIPFKCWYTMEDFKVMFEHFDKKEKFVTFTCEYGRHNRKEDNVCYRFYHESDDMLTLTFFGHFNSWK